MFYDVKRDNAQTVRRGKHFCLCLFWENVAFKATGARRAWKNKQTFTSRYPFCVISQLTNQLFTHSQTLKRKKTFLPLPLKRSWPWWAVILGATSYVLAVLPAPSLVKIRKSEEIQSRNQSYRWLVSLLPHYPVPKREERVSSWICFWASRLLYERERWSTSNNLRICCLLCGWATSEYITQGWCATNWNAIVSARDGPVLKVKLMNTFNFKGRFIAHVPGALLLFAVSHCCHWNARVEVESMHFF